MSHSKPGTAGGKPRTHPLPPDGFDPRAASARELRRYGLPRRPDPAVRPQLAARWDEIFSRKITYITPAFRPLAELLPGVKRRRRRPRRDLVTVPNPTWSGAVVHATGSETFTWVLGQWNVPDVAPGAGGKGAQYTFAFIGIDGNTDVTQIGTIQSVSTATNGSLSKNCYAVFEWYPNSWSAITNLPVSFGDTMIGLICMEFPNRGVLQPAQRDQRGSCRVRLRCSGRDGLVGKSSRVDPRTAGHQWRQSADAQLRRDLLRLGHGRPWTGLSCGWGFGHGDKHGGERNDRGHDNRRDADAHQDRLHWRLTKARVPAISAGARGDL